MKTTRLLLFAVVAVALALFATQWVGSPTPPAGQTRDAPAVGAGGGPAETADPTASFLVPEVVVRDLDGRVVWRGDVDLEPELARIAAGRRDPHRNDGGIFENREGRLPERRFGHYREYVVRTPGLRDVGPQRLVLGADGEVFHTADHYQSFRRVR